MKRSAPRIFWILCTCFLLSSCQPGPKTVAQNFMDAIVQTNFDKAKKYATKDSQDMINLLANISNNVPQAKAKIKSAKVTVKDVQINGDTATVTFFNEEENKEQTLNLVKEDGEWKVSLTIENYMPSFDNENNSNSPSPGDSLSK